jgi:hypothetical protein
MEKDQWNRLKREVIDPTKKKKKKKKTVPSTSLVMVQSIQFLPDRWSNGFGKLRGKWILEMSGPQKRA